MSVYCVLNIVCRATMTNATSISKFGVVCNVLYAVSVLTSFVFHKEEEGEEEEEEEEDDDDDNNNNNNNNNNKLQ
jgi:Ca2+/H+ antiporter